VVSADEAPEAARRLGFPVVVKAVVRGLAHKSEAGAVRVGLASVADVRAGVAEMAGLSPCFLVEPMVPGAIVELLVGVTSDPQCGLALTVGAGGVLVELVQDVVSILLPATRRDVHAALRSLRCWPLLAGHRGRSTDVEAVLDAVGSVVDYACAHRDDLLELEVNPLLVRADGAVAVDAVVRLADGPAAGGGAR
jgi:acetyl-CoA synthetase